MTIAGLKKILAILIALSVILLTSMYYVIGEIWLYLNALVIVMPLWILGGVLAISALKTNKTLGATSIGASIGFISGILITMGYILWYLLTTQGPNLLRYNTGVVILGFTFFRIIPATILGAIGGLIVYLLRKGDKKKSITKGNIERKEANE